MLNVHNALTKQMCKMCVIRLFLLKIDLCNVSINNFKIPRILIDLGAILNLVS